MGVSGNHQSGCGWFVVVLVIAVIGVGFFYFGGGKLFDHAAPPPDASTPVKPTTGTIGYDFTLERFSGVDPWVYIDPSRVWIHVDGHLQGGAHRCGAQSIRGELVLPPGAHQIRLVMEDSFRPGSIHTLQREFRIDAGDQTKCQVIGRKDHFDSLPSGWRWRYSACPDYVTGNAVVSTRSELVARPDALAKEIKKFQRSAAWQAMEAAFERLQVLGSNNGLL